MGGQLLNQLCDVCIGPRCDFLSDKARGVVVQAMSKVICSKDGAPVKVC